MTTTTEPNDHIDVQGIRAFVGDDIREVLETFYESLIESEQALMSALLDDDLATVCLLAHRQKSSSRLIGFNGLAEHLEKIERQAKDPVKPAEKATLASLLTELVSRHRQAEQSLQAWLQS